MSKSRSSRGYGYRRRGLPTWIAVIVTLGAIGLLYWQQGPADRPWKPVPLDKVGVPGIDGGGKKDTVDDEQGTEAAKTNGTGVATDSNPKKIARGSKKKAAAGAASDTSGSIVKGVKIRDRSGDVVYEGDIDLTDTLARIDRNERLEFPHDGTVFQNREGRLPSKSADHYREWVHRTPQVSGPGPQRVVTGEDGEAYYSPDHYETFKRIR